MKLKRSHAVRGILCLLCLFYGGLQLHEFRRWQPHHPAADHASQVATIPRPRAPPALAFRRHPVRRDLLNLTTPVLVMSLPKIGTTSLFRYFTCGGLPAAHTYGYRGADGWFRLGRCLQENYHYDSRAGNHSSLRHRPLLYGCGPYQVWSDLGVVPDRQTTTTSATATSACFYPSLDALERIAEDYPHATLVLSHRRDWLASVQRWGGLQERWIHHCPAFPNTTDAAVWQRFYEQQQQGVRQLVQKHAGLRLIEVDLDEEARVVAAALQEATGISAACWGHCRPDASECVYPEE
jgi:hypothetical protein